MRAASVGGINRDATCRGGQNPPAVLGEAAFRVLMDRTTAWLSESSAYVAKALSVEAPTPMQYSGKWRTRNRGPLRIQGSTATRGP
jgi:hypothetical protein